MMSKLNWYVNRLKSMSAQEIVWRVMSLLRDIVDRYRVAFGFYPNIKSVRSVSQLSDFTPGFSASAVSVTDWSEMDINTPFSEWSDALVLRADKICKHQLSYFDLVDVHHGNPINWLKDHNCGKSSPLRYAQSIDYRDFQSVGDCKLVWEPNRHHHLVVLARAYAATSDARYAQEVVDQINSWIEQNPFGRGMNWRSPLELGVRLINWVWAFDLIRDSGAITQEFFSSFCHQVYLHCWDNTRKYSRGSSANNHLIGEAAGVYIAASYFSEFPEAQKWRVEAKEILENEIINQSFSDGCTREHAFGYQVFVIQFFLYCGLVGKSIEDDFSVAYWERLEKMLGFLGLLAEAGSIPMVGDADDGYVLDMSEYGRDLHSLFSLGAVIFKRKDFKLWSDGKAESVFWLFGISGYEDYINIESAPASKEIESHDFTESGYLLLQTGQYKNSNSISVFFDRAELGYGAIAAHGHADALSITLRVGAKEMLVDPGTYDYFTFPERRSYYRSTAAHNTIVINDMDQSKMLGPFMWGNPANCKSISTSIDGEILSASAEHDGYYDEHGVTHRRSLELHKDANKLLIFDELESGEVQQVSIYFHLSEECLVEKISDASFKIINGNKILILDMDDSLDIATTCDDPSFQGSVSRGYHRSRKTVVIKGVTSFSGAKLVRTSFKVSDEAL